MIQKILTTVFGSAHGREVKRMLPIVAQINELEAGVKNLSDEGLRGRTAEFRTRLENGESLDDLLPEAFAVAREGAWRTVHMRPFDVQLMGGMVLHRGRIAEMKTGEGKTLVATLPTYLNALEGKGVHVVTVNDYLARRDADWMGQIYRFLGLSVGVIQHDLSDAERKRSYNCDVTYGTNNELGFDYLRDNMKFDLDSMVQRPHHYAIVDEVDSILIDEARTPLIISGPSEESVDKYYRIDRIIPRLERGEEIDEGDGQKSTTGDYVVDEKAHQASLTDQGVEKVEHLLGIRNLYEMENMEILHGVNQALRAHSLYRRDVEYLVKDGQVVIVDEFTGRTMPGRRWSDGLHQAVEAKEGVKIERETQTLATITFQNFFRMYKKLAGMTGTADTEAAEFAQIYNLDVTVIPTNSTMIRQDRADLVYRTADEKWAAVVEEIRDAHQRGQPALVGTVSIEKSEMLSRLLNKPPRVPHVVLNAKFHEREASIVAQAGREGSVTIATNMAGRGTDIVLGGNPEGLARSEFDPAVQPEEYAQALERYLTTCAAERNEVIAAGGLHILGTERHESRRIDNQLRGRSGRQGDAGSSRFYLSLEDDLMRIFGSDRIKGLMTKLGMEEGEAIEHGMVSRAIEKAQRQVEGRNFETRKHLLEYDDVMNKQRQEIYHLRKEILEGREGREYVQGICEELIDTLLENHCPEKVDPHDWNLTGLRTDMLAYFNLQGSDFGADLSELGVQELEDTLLAAVRNRYQEREARFGTEMMRSFERAIMLHAVDVAWKDHLLALDHLKEGIGLRGYGQRDPLNEYKRESYELFESMRSRVQDDILSKLFHFEPVTEEDMAEQRRRREMPQPAQLTFSAPAKEANSAPNVGAATVVRKDPKVGRNDPCWCGSGKKFKRCHGA
ncbi:MAG TPA: preprotein translocase subunit SecA [Thermoanaerobaculia bacterium]|nr:preprotein translocase subunit SecA [Thermoanaerobaculia bacterium]